MSSGDKNMLDNAKIPIVGIAGYSGSGKTTLLTRLIPTFTASGIRVGRGRGR